MSSMSTFHEYCLAVRPVPVFLSHPTFPKPSKSNSKLSILLSWCDQVKIKPPNGPPGSSPGKPGVSSVAIARGLLRDAVKGHHADWRRAKRAARQLAIVERVDQLMRERDGNGRKVALVEIARHCNIHRAIEKGGAL